MAAGSLITALRAAAEMWIGSFRRMELCKVKANLPRRSPCTADGMEVHGALED